uniref:Cytochrome P450 705A23-1 n=1 Tax=Isatis tinctoria TaxID=161756 RepID=A0A8F0K7T5_ISATI|nr:cytochrome P450 705A23-1 [Isatis tinctoria]
MTIVHNCLLLIILCLLLLICYSLFFKKPKDGFDLPPSPPSLPIIGHLHLLVSASTHKSLQKLSTKYGPLLHLSIFNVPVIFVSSATVAYEIFRAHDVNFSFRGTPPIGESLLVGSSGFFTAPYGDYFKFIKKIMVTKLLGPHALERSRGIRADEQERFYANLLDKAMKNESVEIGKEAMKFTNNSICKMIMGRSFNEENGEAERVRDLVTESTALTMKIFVANMLQWPLKKLGISLFRREIMGVSCGFDEVLERILDEHEEKKDEDQDMDMMDVLLETYRDETAEYKITRNHIKSLFVDLLIAGTDTSRHATQWTMAEIINNPNVLEKLREEINNVVGETRLVQETDLQNLPYLQAVVKEGLRLHPPGALFARTSREGCRIRGFYVPENTPLVVNAYAVMRDPDSWEDPNEFKPERFLGSSRSGQEDEREQALKYIPFGSGRRGCPGSNLAYIFVGIAIGVMVQCFDWKIKGDKVNMEEARGALVLTMDCPLKCTPVARTSSFLVPDLDMSQNSQT